MDFELVSIQLLQKILSTLCVFINRKGVIHLKVFGQIFS